MVTLRAPDGASEEFQHAVDLFNRDLDGILSDLETKQQNEFWMNLRGYALAQIRGAGPNAQLIADDQVNVAVRGSLQRLAERIAKHTADLDNNNRQQFWQMLHTAAGREKEATKSPKARLGDGGGVV